MKSILQNSRFQITSYIILLVSILFSISGQLLMKHTMTNSHQGLLNWEFLQQLALSITVYCLAIVTWILALRNVKLSIAYPVTSLNYVGILLGSYYFFNEVITITRIIGVLTIFAGVLLVVIPIKKSQ
ncbi:small multidrug resistance protein [Nostoc linckia z18]|jgi:multidrug transporter EmrE-like cation transporter|uniref:Small multidrug resistance protein n=3 Tax=Nostoc TaxID=1177 RepID=A0A9Q5ZFP3_NOSLI|nr:MULTISPECIES: EamA family transporter [Nostoc]MBL1200787.1 EamA family transporter [Nostoc sp. GBBB01]MDZ8014533.1 EamA family transporter [Nostoc sp. ZfuVER08]PHK37178.1 small multidrug resistance protein [Nostoc linckia z15]PHK42042.1 small multidrug resistance protein [Nostoc linckia z16]MBC1236742.1 EamA family transporter [Nostoc sp. 2RC]